MPDMYSLLDKIEEEIAPKITDEAVKKELLDLVQAGKDEYDRYYLDQQEMDEFE